MTKRETDEQIRQMKKFGTEAASSKRKAVAALKAAGIMNEKGVVKEQFKKAFQIAS